MRSLREWVPRRGRRSGRCGWIRSACFARSEAACDPRVLPLALKKRHEVRDVGGGVVFQERKMPLAS